MISRREFLQVAAATAALAARRLEPSFAQQRITQADLLRFEPVGNVTLVHLSDIHAQLMPVLFREPSTNLGVGEARGKVPHITGREFLDLYKIPAGSASAYALTPEDFATLAKSYGRLGGLDRIATVLKAIRAERSDRTVFLDGGDTWQNSFTSMQTKGQDMVDCMALLKPDAMVGHWEFTLGAERVKGAAIPLTRSAPSVNSQWPTMASGFSSAMQSTMSWPLVMQRRVAVLPGVAAVEEHGAVTALGADRLEDRGDAVEPAEPAVALGQRGEILRGQRIGLSACRRDPVEIEKRAAGDVRHRPLRFADADIGRRLAEQHRHELAHGCR